MNTDIERVHNVLHYSCCYNNTYFLQVRKNEHTNIMTVAILSSVHAKKQGLLNNRSHKEVQKEMHSTKTTIANAKCYIYIYIIATSYRKIIPYTFTLITLPFPSLNLRNLSAPTLVSHLCKDMLTFINGFTSSPDEETYFIRIQLGLPPIPLVHHLSLNALSASKQHTLASIQFPHLLLMLKLLHHYTCCTYIFAILYILK